MVTPLSINMNMIDTEYQALGDLDPEIVRFYSEDVRTRVVGHTDTEMPEPITEEYTVIVLNQPDEMTYEYVESRRGRNFPESVVKSFIPSAITWEDFQVNHDGYLSWLDAVAVWESEQPMVQDGVTETGEPNMVLVPQPERPTVDMSIRRAVYELVHYVCDDIDCIELTTYSDTHDDDAFTTLRSKDTEPLSVDQVKAKVLEMLSGKRWVVCNSGITINGLAIQTDVHSKDEMAGYVTESIVNGLTTVYWKLADGNFHVFTVQEFKKVYQLVAKYRNDCFGVEYTKTTELESLDNPTDLDLESGWPTTEFTIGT